MRIDENTDVNQQFCLACLFLCVLDWSRPMLSTLAKDPNTTLTQKVFIEQKLDCEKI